MQQTPRPSTMHYGWVIVATGMLVMLSCLGLARFSFGMLLPSMSTALDLNYAERGYIGTGYFIGYLIMVGFAPTLIKRVGYRSTVTLGLACITCSMGLLGAAGTFWAALLCYTVTGVGSGAANIAMMATMTQWFAPSLRGVATGLVVAGNGLGIVVSGFLIPYIDHISGPEGWRWGWGVLAIISAAVCALAWTLLRNSPRDKGLDMAGDHGHRTPPPISTTALSAADRKLLYHLGAIYFCFGVTYIIYGTFFVTALIDEHGFSDGVAGRFWSAVGFFSMFSGPLFGRISDAFTRKSGMIVTFAVQTAAYLLASLHLGAWPLYLSVVLYGLSAWAIPTIMTATVGDRLGPARTAIGFAIITFFFAVGQVIGPTVAGFLADLTGSFSVSFVLSACGTVGAIVLSLTLPRPETHGRTGS